MDHKKTNTTMTDRETKHLKMEVQELKLLSKQILTKQAEVHETVAEIKNRIFEPDNGLYARVSKNTDFRLTSLRWLWVLTTGLAFSLLKIVLGYVF